MEKENHVLLTDIQNQYPSEMFDFKDTSELEALDVIIGQKRAFEAIAFGLNMRGSGYNIFVTGEEDTGKSTLVKKLLTDHAEKCEPSSDLCLVNNFEDAYCPLVIKMPAGSAVYFSQSMSGFIEVLKVRIPGFFKTPSFQEEQSKVQMEYSDRQKALFKEIEKLALDKGLGIMRGQEGYQVLPVRDGKPLSQEAYQTLDEKEQQELLKSTAEMEEKLNETIGLINEIGEELKIELRGLVGLKTESLISEQIDPIRYYFRDCSDIQAYLKKVKEDIIDNITLFLGVTDQEGEQGKKFFEMTGSLVKRYQVNVLVDRRGEKGAPVVFEPNPSFHNLFGKIEKKPVRGSFTTDFTMVQAGSLLKADKGYLVMQVESLLSNPRVWESLKRSLRDSMLRIEDMPDQADYGMPSLKPEPIQLQVKVILLGGYEPFRMLQRMDAGFNKIFKVRADFDNEAKKTDSNLNKYSRFIAGACKREDLLSVTPEGVWDVIEYGSRLVSDKQKFSLRFGRVLGVLKEADYWARKENAKVITAEYVARAFEKHRFRHNLYEEKLTEGFYNQSVLMDVKGRKEGQVNALAVYDMGEIAFGRPMRITAESYMGKPGIINVEHEADLSGQTHDKGVMIIAGYLGRMFAQTYPLSVSISITFEQSYDGIDGDSASSTELYAVLSSLSGIPIRQGIAVTGSVNQKGEIQSIGGVNEKIEGFYDICLKKGLTKKQGVMIPSSNIKNLVLRKDVVRAIKNRDFHLYHVSSVEEGIYILTGVRAGELDSKGLYAPGTIFGKVRAKLEKYHELSIQYGR